MSHDLLVVLENEIAQKAKTTLVKGNERRHVLATKLLGSPENSAVSAQRYYKADTLPELVSEFRYTRYHYVLNPIFCFQLSGLHIFLVQFNGNHNVNEIVEFVL